MIEIKGIKRGKIIELSKEINIPDSQEVNLKIEVIQQMSNEERLEKMKELLANWEEKDDFIRTMEELEREENAYREARLNFPKLIEAAIRGEEVVIEKDGQPVVKLVAVSPDEDKPFDEIFEGVRINRPVET